MRVDLTIVLDSHDCVEKTILLNQATVDNSLVGILGGSVLKWVLLLICFLFLGGCLCIRIGFIFNFNIDMAAISSELSNKSIIFVFVERVDVSELAEDEVIRAGEVESLGGEFILVRIRNSHGNIVVRAESTDAAPEKELLEVRARAIVQQSLHSHVQAKSN